MKFFTINKNQIVWDAGANKALCQFKDGELATDDKETIAVLKSLGYEHEPEPVPAVPAPNKGGKK